MRIAVIGLGGMGSALAERLLDEGHRAGVIPNPVAVEFVP